MQVNLTRGAAHKMSTLLDAGLCTRSELIEHLTSPALAAAYALSPNIQPDDDGYIVCPWRTVNCGEIPTSELAEAVLRDLADRFHLSPEKRSSESTSMALDAILSGVLTAPLPLHPPRIIRHTSSRRPKLSLSHEALLGIARLARSYAPITNAPVDSDSPRCSTGQRKPYKYLSRMVEVLGQFHFMWADSSQRALQPHLRHYVLCSVPNYLIEHFAREGSTLGIPPLAGGRRTTLSLASNTLEAIGQGVIAPERLREQLTHASQDDA